MPIADGSYGVEAGHEATVTIIQPGTLHYCNPGGWRVAHVSTGIAEIMPEYVVLLLAAAEWPEEIDMARAEEAKRRAEGRMQASGSLHQHMSAQAALTRALARLKKRNEHPF